jgi:hypothetical protein
MNSESIRVTGPRERESPRATVTLIGADRDQGWVGVVGRKGPVGTHVGRRNKGLGGHGREGGMCVEERGIGWKQGTKAHPRAGSTLRRMYVLSASSDLQMTGR